MQSETSTTALLVYLRALLATYEMVHNRLKDDTVITRQALANSCCHSLAMSPFEDIYPTSLVQGPVPGMPLLFFEMTKCPGSVTLPPRACKQSRALIPA